MTTHYIQLINGNFSNHFLPGLPEFHWTLQGQQVPLTAQNAEQFGYVPVQTYYTNQVQMHLDAKANERGYDSILSACSYAAVPNFFQAESVAFIHWRSAVWAYLHQGLSEVLAGNRAMPKPEVLLAELPTLESFEVPA